MQRRIQRDAVPQPVGRALAGHVCVPARGAMAPVGQGRAPALAAATGEDALTLPGHCCAGMTHGSMIVMAYLGTSAVSPVGSHRQRPAKRTGWSAFMR